MSAHHKDRFPQPSTDHLIPTHPKNLTELAG